MEKKYVVYKHTNRINGKVYIGKTCQELKVRFGSNGIGYRQCKYFWNAICKYGWDAFDHDILETGLFLEEANKKEKEYILKYNSTNPLYGYNIRKGGDGFDSESSLKLWEDVEYKNKIIKANKENWKNSDYRDRIISSMKESWKDLAKRKRRSELAVSRWKEKEYRDKVTSSVKQVCGKKIICIETGAIYNSITDASKIVGVSDKNASRAITHGYTWGGYHWKYIDDSISA